MSDTLNLGPKSSPGGEKHAQRSGLGFRQHMLTRAVTVFYIMLCFGMGIVLLLAPWLPDWTGNFFAQHYLWIKVLAHNDYVRGGISGIGLADLCLGAYETGRFRQRARALQTAPDTSN